MPKKVSHAYAGDTEHKTISVILGLSSPRKLRILLELIEYKTSANYFVCFQTEDFGAAPFSSERGMFTY